MDEMMGWIFSLLGIENWSDLLELVERNLEVKEWELKRVHGSQLLTSQGDTKDGNKQAKSLTKRLVYRFFLPYFIYLHITFCIFLLVKDDEDLEGEQDNDVQRFNPKKKFNRFTKNQKTPRCDLFRMLDKNECLEMNWRTKIKFWKNVNERIKSSHIRSIARRKIRSEVNQPVDLKADEERNANSYRILLHF